MFYLQISTLDYAPTALHDAFSSYGDRGRTLSPIVSGKPSMMFIF